MSFFKLRLPLIVLLFLPILFSLSTPAPLEALPFQDPIPDYIFYNGTVITLEDSRPVVSAVATLGDIIIALGNETDVFRYADNSTEVIDLNGMTIVPGFIDSHSHWIGDRGLTNTTDFNDVMNILVSSGWTSISELFVNEDRLNELQAVDEAGLLKIRVNGYLPLGYTFDRFGDWYQAYTMGHEYSSRLRIAGVKLFTDGWMYNPTIFINQSEMNQLVQETHTLGFQIATHSLTANATDIVLNAYESVIGAGPNNLRHRIEHLALLRSDQISELAALDVIASVQFSWFNSDWNPDLEPLIGRERSLLTGRWRDLVNAGVHVIGSTDYPYVANELKTPIGLLAATVTRIGVSGATPTDFMLNQTITREQALRALTLDGAYATFQESEKGSIKFGKLADLVILSDNPLTVPAEEINQINIEMTMINGEIVYTRPDPPETTTEVSFPSITSSSLPSTTETSQSSSFPSTTPISINAAMFVAFVFLGLRKSHKNKRP